MNEDKARLETQIARAHRAIWMATQSADALSYDGLSEDLRQLLVELTRLQTDLLKTGRPRRMAVGPPQRHLT